MQKCVARSSSLVLPAVRSARPTSSARSARIAGVRTMAAAAVAPTSAKENYEEAAKMLKEISTLGGISGLLGWDELVMMPQGAAPVRSAQKEVLAGITFEKRTDKKLGELLDALIADTADLDEYETAVVRDAHRDYHKTMALSKELVMRKAKLDSEGYQAWVKARGDSDFSVFGPKLKEWLALTKEIASAKNPDLPIYDACLDDYERGMTAERLDEIFAQIKERLIPLLKLLREKGVKPDASFIKGDFDTKAQADLCHAVAKDLGFNTDCGRLDVSVHPFTGGAHPTDVRMTTRFKSDDLMEGITGAIHETGHALYEQGRNLKYDGLPVNSSLSMGIHESQSLLWERMVALSPEFAQYLMPRLRDSFPQIPEDKTPTDLYGAINQVKERSMIRVESDEVTYPMHVILRYELERAMIEGTLDVDDLPAAWNAKMEEYLGVTPENDAEGCLQDVHWAAGALGYFPTYTIGAMCACQIFDAASNAIPDLGAKIAAGDFAPLKAWLNEKVHVLGSLHPSGDELMTVVTGKPLDPTIFMDYLTAKYTKLYQLE